HSVPTRAFMRATRRRKRNTGAPRGRRTDTSLHKIATGIAVFYFAYTGKPPPRGRGTRSPYIRFGLEIFHALGFGDHPSVLSEAAIAARAAMKPGDWQYSTITRREKP